MQEKARFTWISVLAGIIITYTVLIMANWVTGRHTLDFSNAQWIGMVFNTALLFSTLTVSQLLSVRAKGRSTALAAVLASGVAVFSAAAMLQYLTGIDLGINQLFVRTDEPHRYSSSPGSMAPMTAVNFIASASVILIHGRMHSDRYRRLAMALLAVVFCTSVFIVCGRLLNTPELGNIPGKTSMAATTAVVFLLQIVLSLLVNPVLILDRIHTSYTFRMVIYRGLPLLLVAPILLQIVIFSYEGSGQISDAMGHSVYVALFIVCAIFGLLYLAGLLYKTEQKERAANERYNRFFSLSDDFLLIVHTDGQAVAMNETWSRELGWTQEELFAQKMDSFAHPSERRHLPEYADRIEREEQRAVQRIGIATKGGELRMIEWAANKDPATQLIYLIGRDVTQQFELENRQIQARHLAEEGSRAKSDFLANMSHELRTPLNSIIGFTEVLGDRLYGNLNDRQQEYITYIDQSARHLLNLINDVLDLSKIEAGKMVLDLQWCSLRQLVESAMMMFREKCFRGGIVLSARFDSDDNYMLMVDERKVKQILYNLLSNGVKFTPSGGQVTVTVGETRQDDRDLYVLSVADTGQGIAEEQQELLFTKFHQAETVYDKVHEGTGLGLALTKELVELHGGTIEVQSRPGEGSRFTLYIPVKRQPEEGMVQNAENIDSRR